MSLETRIGKMEAASQPVRVVRIDAKDEEDCQRQCEGIFFSSIKTPGPLELEIHMNGEVRRERMNVLSFEEYLELLD